MEQAKIQQQTNTLQEIQLIQEENQNISKKVKLKDKKHRDSKNVFFVQIGICSIMLIGTLYLKYIEPNHISNENIKVALMQTVTIEDVEQLVSKLTEMSDQYWRIK